MVSKAQARATAKYDSNNYDKVSLRIRNDADCTRAMIQQAATAVGESLNQYILTAVKMRMEKGV